MTNQRTVANRHNFQGPTDQCTAEVKLRRAGKRERIPEPPCAAAAGGVDDDKVTPLSS